MIGQAWPMALALTLATRRYAYILHDQDQSEQLHASLEMDCKRLSSRDISRTMSSGAHPAEPGSTAMKSPSRGSESRLAETRSIPLSSIASLPSMLPTLRRHGYGILLCWSPSAT